MQALEEGPRQSRRMDLPRRGRICEGVYQGLVAGHMLRDSSGSPFRPLGTFSIDGGGCVSTHMSALAEGGRKNV